MHLDHFGSVTSIEEITCIGSGLKLSILCPLPTTAWREILCFWSICLGLNGHSEELRMQYWHWQELINVNYEQISFLNKLNFVLENVYDKPKLQTTNAVASSPHGSKMATSQMRIKISNSKNSQRIAFPDNAEITRCLAPFSRPGQKRTIISLRRRRDLWN